jgi:hypothetical protein
LREDISLFTRTLSIHEDGWGRIAIAPKNSPDQPLALSYTAFKSLTADVFFPVSQTTWLLSAYIKWFQKKVFAVVQDLDQGCAIYGLQEDGIIQTLCLTNTTRSSKGEVIEYADVLAPFQGFANVDDPNAIATLNLLHNLGGETELELLDTWSSPNRRIDLSQREAIAQYLGLSG